MDSNKYNKKQFLSLVVSIHDSISSSAENAAFYLSDQGINPDEIKYEGLKRIKKMQLQIEAEKTKSKMEQTKLIFSKATDMARSIISNPDFSFASFLNTHNLALQNRNIDSLSKEDIENTIIQYFYLKYLEEDSSTTDNDKS